MTILQPTRTLQENTRKCSRALILTLLCLLTSQLSQSVGLPAKRDSANLSKSSSYTQENSHTQQLREHSLKRRQSSDSIECNDATIERIKEVCKMNATLTTISNNTSFQRQTIRSSFCDTCRIMLYEYGKKCNKQQFILNVTGVCTRGRETQCLFAVVVSKPSLIACIPPEVEYVVLNNTSASELHSNEFQCTLIATYSEYVPYTPVRGPSGIEYTPPIEPPWKGQCPSYPAVLGHITTTTTASMETTTAVTTTALSTTQKASSDMNHITQPTKKSNANSCCTAQYLVLTAALLMAMLSTVL